MLFQYLYTCLYRVFLEECAVRRDNVPEVKSYRYNIRYRYPKFNGYGDNGSVIFKERNSIIHLLIIKYI